MRTWIEEKCGEKLRFAKINNEIKQIVLKKVNHPSFIEVCYEGGYRIVPKSEIEEVKQ